MSETTAGFPPGLTPEVVERVGHVIRQAAGRAFQGRPLNPYELEAAAAALLGMKPPRPSEYHDTREPPGPQRVCDTEGLAQFEAWARRHLGTPDSTDGPDR